MSVDSYDDLREHIGHKIAVVCYTGPGETDPRNIAIECEDCSLVLLDYDHPDAASEPVDHWDVLQTDAGSDWQAEVTNGDTVLGLMEWIAHQDEADAPSCQWCNGQGCKSCGGTGRGDTHDPECTGLPCTCTS